MRKQLACFLLATALATTAREAAAQDEDVSIVINPRTGAASLRNDSASTLNIDGYLLVAGQDAFDPVGWTSLQDGAMLGWFEGQANDQIISEVNLDTSLAIPAGGTVGVGMLYDVFSPSAIGEREPRFDFTYSVEGGGVFNGEIEFEVQNNVVLVVNPNTGAATLENQSVFDVSIDSYLVQSPSDVLSTAGWSTLAGSVGGWAASPGSSRRIGEANLDGSTLLTANGGSLSIGTAIDPAGLSDESDLLFQFSIAAEGGAPGVNLVGGVLFSPAGVSPTLPGDFNMDGSVDAADYTVWRDGLGTTFSQSDYDVWRSHYGQTQSAPPAAATQAVPEPGVIGMSLIGLAVGLSYQRRTGRRRTGERS